MAREHLYNIPFGVPFLDALAEGLLARFGKDPLLLAQVRVLLPNRRSCLGLQEALFRKAGNATLLPIIQPVGDANETELIDAQDIPVPLEAVSRAKRRLLLSGLIRQWHKEKHGRSLRMDQAMQLAEALTDTLDEMQQEHVSFDALKSLVPDELAEHWQLTLDFFTVLTRQWPEVLKREATSDRVLRMNQLLEAQAQQWKKHPPAIPVIVAGTTGSIPATRALIHTVLHYLPQGYVVLPGLDQGMPEEQWQALHRVASHPQYGLHLLLKALGAERKEVTIWPYGTAMQHNKNRETLLRMAMDPEADWGKLALPPEAVQGIALLDADTIGQEAMMIAMMMRHHLETSAKQIALVTHDRALARYVIAHLRRWGIDIDDSAGLPLNQSPPMVLMRLILSAATQHYNVVVLLALLKHPLVACGDKALCRRNVRLLERECLRGVIKYDGWPVATGKHAVLLNRWLEKVRERLKPLDDSLAKGRVSFQVLMQVHLQVAEALADTDDLAGHKTLWQGDEGQNCREFIEELTEAIAGHPDVYAEDYAGVFDTLLIGRQYHLQRGQHPRLHILSPLEARLHQYDVVILGGLQEGVWPRYHHSFWMSEAMRMKAGLPSADREVGLAAHDFVQCCAAPHVYLSWHAKAEGSPCAPSPFLTRLQTVLKAAGKDISQPLCEVWQRELSGSYAKVVVPIAP
ncbi:MAG: hypothetical protein KDD76_06120, partial [Rickettsiales bacterium]|nr:hypothetical protein [Rickettsiales bacterium]